jgi:GAF domain-containing protein
MSENWSEDGSTSREGQAAFASLSRMILEEEPLDAILLGVAQSARRTIKQARDVSVTMIDDDQASTVVFTGALAIDLDQVQYETGSGPCLEAARAGSTLVVDHGQPDTPFPAFSQHARERGVSYSVSVGLQVPARVVAGLNIYLTSDDPPDEESLQLAQTFATYAGVAVANSALPKDSDELAGLRLAIRSRVIIDQAKAVLVANNDYSGDEALAALITTSARRRRRLVDTARDAIQLHADS